MTDDLGLSPVLLAVIGGPGGHWLPRRTGVQQDDEPDESEGEEEDGDDPGESALARLLRHEPAVACGGHVDNIGASAHSRGAVLAWIERNRVWLVPWASALLVVMIEIGAALFAARPIPTEGHMVLGAFWVFAVGRGSARAAALHERSERLKMYARRRGIPLEEAREEWRVFQAQIERMPLPEGRDKTP